METTVPESVPTRVGNFVKRHKVGIAVTVTAGICLALNRLALRDHDKFLADEGLLEKFYTPSDEE